MHDALKHWPPEWPYRPDSPPVTADSAMVATTDRYASEEYRRLFDPAVRV